MRLNLLFGVPFKGKDTLSIVQYQQQTLFRRELDINQIHFLIWGINGPKTAFINMINELNFIVDLGCFRVGCFNNFVDGKTLPLVEDSEVVLVDFGH
jgi:hypothetical protein